MSMMIKTAPGFQSSVNIAYDLGDNDKLKSYIPTKSALNLLEEILLSTDQESNRRARILIGAYGKGKSHIVLMILSILMKKPLELFSQMIPIIKRDNPSLFQLIENYYKTPNKGILPVVITGSSTSLSQAFLIALQRTLEENELMDIMPETSFKAATSTIARWKTDYPDTYQRMIDLIDEDGEAFTSKLENYDSLAYEKFNKIYPELTAGSVFNPFVGFDVNELYENVVRGLHAKGYSGIYIVYDEFSKYLENNIAETTKRDTKTLQDLAEKCNRSGQDQLHLMLISHKEITSYIDRVSKEMIDGWRGVSERFIHIYLNNNFTQTYEVIESAIIKDIDLWSKFSEKHNKEFESMFTRYCGHSIFEDSTDKEIKQIIKGCFPLHPVSTFILPRLSERVAQNERTLFTFISSKGEYTLHSFLNGYNDDKFELVTPDLIYDYFEPLLQQEVYSGNLHKYYILTASILNKVGKDSLEGKIVKVIALIYILEQFEKLMPTIDELIGVFSVSYKTEEIQAAINHLIDDEYVVYLKRSNNYLKLKETSGVNIRSEIDKMKEKLGGRENIKDILNAANFDNYMFPSRYNDEKEMTRYFIFEFLDASEIAEGINWDIKSERIKADGIIYGILSDSVEQKKKFIKILEESSKNFPKGIFIVLKKPYKIADTLLEYSAVSKLRDTAVDDSILFNDYDVVYEDLREVLRNYISEYTRPEKQAAEYYFLGKKCQISRKRDLTELLSGICDKLYFDTPIINNESVNRDEVTTVTQNSINKIIAALLRTELEPNLGLTGNGPEISIMRSTLLNTGVVCLKNGIWNIDIHPEDLLLSNVLQKIEEFIYEAKNKNQNNFADLYDSLTNSKYGIGLRRGLIPIYLAAVLHKHKRDISISDRAGQIPLTVDVIEQINAQPNLFSLSYLDWNPQKEAYLKELETTYKEYIVEAEKNTNDYDFIVSAMKRWYLSLPKYSKELKVETKDSCKKSFILELKRNEGGLKFLFERLPNIFGYTDVNGGLVGEVKEAKSFYDSAFSSLLRNMGEYVKSLFVVSKDTTNYDKMSISSVIKDWCETLDPAAFEQLFTDGTEKCLKVFQNASNDDMALILNLGKISTDLRMEDWDDDVIKIFEDNLIKYKDTAENFHRDITGSEKVRPSSQYELTFTDEEGKFITKRFDKVEESKRARLLYNSVKSQIDAMGQSISNQEKRQVLMEVLKELC